MTYDCTEEIKKHRDRVHRILQGIADELASRGKIHDMSKIQSPLEKISFDHWLPEIRKYEFGSENYKNALAQMGTGLTMHYDANRHHPEHFPDGIDGMSLIDLIEMLADWMAVCAEKNVPVDLISAKDRWKIGDQLMKILENTLREQQIEISKANDGMPDIP